jgi:flagellar basal-body rod protein FlgB
VRVDDIPLLAVLKGRLQYLSHRQSVIAENVANADVTGYTPKDLKALSFAQMLGRAQGVGGVTLQLTDPAHMAGPGGGSAPDSSLNFKSVSTPDSETKMNGNSVVLEEEMLKMAESRMAYDAAIGLYQHSMNMLKTAARKPGG